MIAIVQSPFGLPCCIVIDVTAMKLMELHGSGFLPTWCTNLVVLIAVDVLTSGIQLGMLLPFYPDL